MSEFQQKLRVLVADDNRGLLNKFEGDLRETLLTLEEQNKGDSLPIELIKKDKFMDAESYLRLNKPDLLILDYSFDAEMKEQKSYLGGFLPAIVSSLMYGREVVCIVYTAAEIEGARRSEHETSNKTEAKYSYQLNADSRIMAKHLEKLGVHFHEKRHLFEDFTKSWLVLVRIRLEKLSFHAQRSVFEFLHNLYSIQELKKRNKSPKVGWNDKAVHLVDGSVLAYRGLFPYLCGCYLRSDFQAYEKERVRLLQEVTRMILDSKAYMLKQIYQKILNMKGQRVKSGVLHAFAGGKTDNPFITNVLMDEWKRLVDYAIDALSGEFEVKIRRVSVNLFHEIGEEFSNRLVSLLKALKESPDKEKAMEAGNDIKKALRLRFCSRNIVSSENQQQYSYMEDWVNTVAEDTNQQFSFKGLPGDQVIYTDVSTVSSGLNEVLTNRPNEVAFVKVRQTERQIILGIFLKSAIDQDNLLQWVEYAKAKLVDLRFYCQIIAENPYTVRQFDLLTDSKIAESLTCSPEASKEQPGLERKDLFFPPPRATTCDWKSVLAFCFDLP